MASLLAGILLPASTSRPKTSTAKIRCLENVRQLARASQMYATENRDFLPAAHQYDTRPAVVPGDIGFPSRLGWNPTNTVLLSPLATYLEGYRMWKCPSDPSTVKVDGKDLPRLRSYSMNGSFGSGEWLDGGPNPQQTRWLTFKKTTDASKPDLIFLFTDEHPASINDSAFQVMATDASSILRAKIIDFPSNRHSRGAVLVSTDGHGDYRRWRSSLIGDAPFTNGVWMPLNVPAANATMDTSWLAERAALPRIR